MGCRMELPFSETGRLQEERFEQKIGNLILNTVSLFEMPITSYPNQGIF